MRLQNPRQVSTEKLNRSVSSNKGISLLLADPINRVQWSENTTACISSMQLAAESINSRRNSQDFLPFLVDSFIDTADLKIIGYIILSDCYIFI